MTGKVQKKRDALAAKLTDIAEARIIEHGITAIKARDLAKEAGCAVGAIYNVFDDLNKLIMAVNGRTFQRLGKHVAAAVIESQQTDPTERLIIMAKAYLGFASDNTNLWRTLFDLEMSTDQHVPEWYLSELAAVFGLINAPLKELLPEKPPKEIELMTRALFSSVHGIVLLGLEKRISAVPVDHMEQMIEIILRSIKQKQTVS